MAAVASVSFNFKDKDGNSVAGQTIPVDSNGNVPVAPAASELFLGSVGGQTNAWQAADASLTRPANATAYAAHQAVGSSSAVLFKFTNFFRKTGGTGQLNALRLIMNAAGIATGNAGTIRGHLYNAVPATAPAAADQATFNSLAANLPMVLGSVDFATWTSGGTGSDIIASIGLSSIGNLPIRAANGARDLYLILEANGPFTPVSGTVITPYAAAQLD